MPSVATAEAEKACKSTTESSFSLTSPSSSFAKIEKFIQEIYWRTYWKGWLELRPAVWEDFISEGVEIYDESAYEKATNGNTGIDCFDFWINELKEENYLHNHTRMWFASIWIFTLGLPWQLGAEFFMKYLLDGYLSLMG